ncbi:uncharacterized protein LOC126902665 [Daktulosphaira vitifoliae]|uniref:uncharacterized protein LOC126902665 n=1 Tax=Daktulosphaira vitifoliae TaxID=58002 RepID=UPI0021AA3FBB|nr:uncharacterized protein LOC126902665 [Daktulosphaira vitifoliae]
MIEKLVITPWSSDSEWQIVKNDIFENKNETSYKSALRKILIWKTRVESLPRGLQCTEILLQVVIKDPYFCKNSKLINESDLVRLYSMSVMRFVNLTADILGKGAQKSLYARASSIELPTWLIDLRHKISHDQDLPTLKDLRAAVKFALEWLQIKYWSVDENFQIKTTKLNVDIVDEFTNIIDSYILNRNLKNSSKYLNINTVRQRITSFECSKISKPNKECTKKIKELLSDNALASQLINVFCTHYLLQAQEDKTTKGRISKVDKSSWSILLKIISTLGLISNLLQCLVIQESYIAALWIVELCIVIHKNNKKIETNHNEFDTCLGIMKNIDTSIVLKIALKMPHKYTSVFLRWLLKIQTKLLSTKQQQKLIYLTLLYTRSPKLSSKLSDHIYTVNELLHKNEEKHKLMWSLAEGQTIWQLTPIGPVL